MGQETYLILAIIITGFAILIWLVSKISNNKSTSQESQVLLEWLKTTQSDITKLQNSITSTLQKSDKNVTHTLQQSYNQLNSRLDNAAKIIGELKQQTGEFTEVSRSVKDLQVFLNSPKIRGGIGEKVLTDLLNQVLPSQTFTTQHRYSSGDIVDVVIKTQAGLIPIDSKFPMENFIKMNSAEKSTDKVKLKKAFINDVKKHIRTISKKYIKTSEKTVDFALMYIPSESVYYEITAVTPELSDYSQENRVLTVSPATLYAFLRTIYVSFEGQRIAKEAQSVLRNLRQIQTTAVKFGDQLQTLQRHITNAHNNMTGISSEFNQLQSKIDTTNQIGSGIDQDSVTK